MLILGRRMYFKKNVVRAFGQCRHCGVYGKNVSYQARKFGHIYFIPLLPMGAKSQVLRECKRCGKGTHIPLPRLETNVDTMAEQFKSWITALADGKSELVLKKGDEPENIGILIIGILPDLYCLKEIESIEAINSMLDANNMGYEKEIIVGRWQELKGDLQQAKLNYKAAEKLQPNNPFPLYQIGMVELKQKNIPAAEVAFKKYLTILPNEMLVYVALGDAYELDKNYPKIVEIYDEVFRLRPDFIADKGLRKLYKKACKKSGINGKFLDQI